MQATNTQRLGHDSVPILRSNDSKYTKKEGGNLLIMTTVKHTKLVLILTYA